MRRFFLTTICLILILGLPLNLESKATPKVLSTNHDSNAETSVPQVIVSQNSFDPSESYLSGTDSYTLSLIQDSVDSLRNGVVDIAPYPSSIVYFNGQNAAKLVALTFDDGPDDTVTPKILDILKEHKVLGNFFFVGSYVKIFPSITKRAYQEGHLVLNHSYSHLIFMNRSDEYINNEFQLTDEQFLQVVGKSPAMMRPPYGKINDQVINIARTHGVKLILWSIDSLDWSAPEKGNIRANVINNLKPGAIILMHSNADKQATADALPGIIEDIQARGYKIVTLDYLLNEEGYK